MSILSERVVPISEAPQHVPGRPHTATIWRWYQRGISGIKLETFLAGGKRFTTIEAIERFILASTEARDGVRPEQTPSRRRQAAIDKAERELEAAGI